MMSFILTPSIRLYGLKTSVVDCNLKEECFSELLGNCQLLKGSLAQSIVHEAYIYLLQILRA